MACGVAAFLTMRCKKDARKWLPSLTLTYRSYIVFEDLFSGWWFQTFFNLGGNDPKFDEHIIQMG